MNRVLVCHVRYREPGGEDAVFETETGMLRDAGVEVGTVDLRSSDVMSLSPVSLVKIGLSYPDHSVGRGTIRDAVRIHRPDVVHFHNLYPQLGSGAIDEASRLGCATVQTLHNYRLSCLAGTHLLRSQYCDLCSPARLSAGVRRGCYRGSRVLSQLARSASSRQWRAFLDHGRPLLWLALTDFQKAHYVRLGAPAERIVVKPNSVASGSPRPRSQRTGVFCGGRLTREKGILPLMLAWPDEAPLLTVAGSGPLEREAKAAAKANVRFVGRLGPDGMKEQLRSAMAVAMPSIWPETLGLVVLEAFSEGTPVVAFGRWSLGTVVEELSPRCIVGFGDFPGLVKRTLELCDDPLWDDLSARCITLWERKYSHPVNRDALLRAYEVAIDLKRHERQERL